MPALEILIPDDAIRNLIRQGKVEQIYSVMQTASSRGMQTMEQSLAELVFRRVVTKEDALAWTSRAEQFESLLDRAGHQHSHEGESRQTKPSEPAPLGAGLRVVGGDAV